MRLASNGSASIFWRSSGLTKSSARGVLDVGAGDLRERRVDVRGLEFEVAPELVGGPAAGVGAFERFRETADE
ncbi:hypothetical protein AB0K52_20045 [Glycomyces sp. NPDC049804]|uniref:hypothetical protein n=1 Tax=Glycomyces sp. NPDC049804 TaxID=3154363 RepID=UPI003432DA73